MEWWKKTIVYECYPKSFLSTKGKETGDLQGLISKLDYLKTLGVGAIWLTPIFKSPMVDNGYDVADYTFIDPSYGTMEDMDELFTQAKKRDIKIVLDLVFNHTSDQNKWFLESRKSKDNPYADWYIWKDPKKDGSVPTNWRGIFGGSVWEWCEERGQYYLHTFAKQQPDLNWANPEVRKAIYDASNFWVEKGAGGFRLDAISYIKKPDEYVDGTPDAEDGTVNVHTMTAVLPGILDYLHEFKENVREGHDIFTVGEANGVKPEDLKYWVGSEGVFDMVFEFSHADIDFKNVESWAHTVEWDYHDLKRCFRESEEATKTNGWYPIFLENHDNARCVNKYFKDCKDTDKAAKVAGTIVYTLKGTPFIFQGQEIGMTNVEWDDIETYNDISSRGQYQIMLRDGLSHIEAMRRVKRFTRDSARTPMQWNNRKNAGFTSGTPWLPVHENYLERNVEAQEKDPNSVLSWYRTLKDLREKHPVLCNGTFEEVLAEDGKIFGYHRKNECEDLLILVNFTNSKATYSSDIENGYSVLLDSLDFHTADVLEPYEAVIFEKMKG